MLRYSPTQKKISQTMQHRIMGDLSAYINLKTFPALFIQDREHSQCPTIPSSVIHKVIAPDVILMLRAKSNTVAVLKPQLPLF